MPELTRRLLVSLAAVPPALVLAPAARAAAGAIEEAGFAPIGGVDQWVAIRGRDRSRPAVLFLDGGPGEAQSPFLSEFAPWEDRWVVAQWDQRGSGKTFEKLGTSTPDMTLDQMTRDVAEVARRVLDRLEARKLILVGHSWGSMLGLCAVRARPELFHAFVGTGQVVSGREILEGMRSSAIARARAANDAEAVAELKGLSPSDLADLTKLGVVFKWQAPFAGPDKSYVEMEYNRSGPEADSWLAGGRFSLSKLMQSVVDFDARSAGYDFPIPYFVIQGRDDPRTPPEAARAFVDRVRAPAKGYAEIEGGHFACFTNPAGFLDALDSNVRRLRTS